MPLPPSKRIQRLQAATNRAHTEDDENAWTPNSAADEDSDGGARSDDDDEVEEEEEEEDLS